MSRKEDVSRIVKDLCQRSGGVGGGRPDIAQGKVELSKFLKVLDRV